MFNRFNTDWSAQNSPEDWPAAMLSSGRRPDCWPHYLQNSGTSEAPIFICFAIETFYSRAHSFVTDHWRSFFLIWIKWGKGINKEYIFYNDQSVIADGIPIAFTSVYRTIGHNMRSGRCTCIDPGAPGIKTILTGYDRSDVSEMTMVMMTKNLTNSNMLLNANRWQFTISNNMNIEDKYRTIRNHN